MYIIIIYYRHIYYHILAFISITNLFILSTTTIKEMLQKLVDGNRSDWEEKLGSARLEARATAKDIKVGDHVLLKANEPLSLTAKWDFGYIVSKVNGASCRTNAPRDRGSHLDP